MNFSFLSDYLDKFLTDFSVPAAECTVYRDHNELFRYTAGWVDAEKRGKPNGDTLFWMYSATKVCTAAAAMQMLERGLLHEDEPVSRYLPEFAELIIEKKSGYEKSTRPLLIKHLLSMQGGFDYELGSELREYIASHPKANTRSVVGKLALIPLSFEPGTHFQYSFCLDILGAVMEAASGMTLGEWMEKEIFTPLGMKNTSFAPKQKALDRLCVQYRMDENGKIFLIGPENFCRLTENFESAGGGLCSTVNDYLLLADALACEGVGKTGERILKSESIAKFGINLQGDEAMKDFKRRYQRPGYGYGYGVRCCISDDNPEPRGCFGWDGAAGAHVLIDPKNHLSLVYIQHVQDMEFIYDGIFPEMDRALYQGFALSAALRQLPRRGS